MQIDRILTVAWLVMSHQGAMDAALFVSPAEIKKQAIEPPEGCACALTQLVVRLSA